MTAAYQDGLVDPYALSAQNLAPETPGLDRVLNEATRQLALGLRVALPASVVALRGEQLVDVQPLLKTRYVNGTVTPLPVVPNALVCGPMGAGWGVKLPLAVGDTGLAVFCDRSMDAWTAGNGGVVDPADSRAHDLCDAVFLPGLVPSQAQTTDGTTDLVVSNGAAQLRVSKAGTFELSNGSAELVSLVSQLSNSLATLCNILATQTFTMTALGPMPFLASTIAAIQSQQQAVQGILAKVNTLKGGT